MNIAVIAGVWRVLFADLVRRRAFYIISKSLFVGNFEEYFSVLWQRNVYGFRLCGASTFLSQISRVPRLKAKRQAGVNALHRLVLLPGGFGTFTR